MTDWSAVARERTKKLLERDPDHFRKIGKRGGVAVLDKRGRAHLAKLGRKGGKANARKPRRHFERIGKQGARRLRALVEAGRAAGA